MYKNGRGVNRNAIEAVKWLLEAAEQGHADAQYNLGAMYTCVEEILQDDRKAMEWFHKAAQYKLGKMYDSRIETEERMAVE